MTQLKEPLDLKAAHKTNMKSSSKTLNINIMQYVENFSVTATEYGKSPKIMLKKFMQILPTKSIKVFRLR